MDLTPAEMVERLIDYYTENYNEEIDYDPQGYEDQLDKLSDDELIKEYQSFFE